MAGHGHSHECGGTCDHSAETGDMATLYSLYKYIDHFNVQCLNEEIADTGKNVFRPYEERLDPDKFVVSDADEELLFNIPFTGNVKIKGIIVCGEEGDTHPKTISLFKNRAYMTFDDTQGEADQVVELVHDINGNVEYPVKASRFNSVHHLSIHVKENFGAETSRVNYIGLRGDFSAAFRQEVLVTNYELRPNPADHKTESFNTANHMIQ